MTYTNFYEISDLSSILEKLQPRTFEGQKFEIAYLTFFASVQQMKLNFHYFNFFFINQNF